MTMRDGQSMVECPRDLFIDVMNALHAALDALESDSSEREREAVSHQIAGEGADDGLPTRMAIVLADRA